MVEAHGAAGRIEHGNEGGDGVQSGGDETSLDGQGALSALAGALGLFLSPDSCIEFEPRDCLAAQYFEQCEMFRTELIGVAGQHGQRADNLLRAGNERDAGVGSATLNTAQMVGGSIGTALLNTLVASASTSYLVGRALDPANVQAAQLHGYTTAFVWCALVFAVAAFVAGLVLPPGNLKALMAPEHQIVPVEPGFAEAPRRQLCRVRIACR